MLFSRLIQLMLVASAASIQDFEVTRKLDTNEILASARRLTPVSKKQDFSIFTSDKTKKINLRGKGRQSNPCVLVELIAQLESGKEERKWRCRLSDEDKATVGRRFIDIEGLTVAELAKAESGRSTFYSDEAQLSDKTLNVPSNAKKVFGISKAAKSGRVEKLSKTGLTNDGIPIRGRSLSHETTDNRIVLATRVDANDASTGFTMAKLSDELFGIGTDPVNLVERFDTCSYGAMTMEAFDGMTSSNFQVNDGVTQVTINQNVNGASVFDIEAIVEAALESQLGSLYNQFDHVMLCLPPGTLFSGNGWIAYAYFNDIISVYNNQWCNYVSAQVHELGHNLNLQHSNDYVAGQYEDQIGFMGYSYSVDDQLMCYNAPKSYELGWYGHATIDLDLLNSGGYNGQFIGIDDYDPSSTGGGPNVIATVKQSTSNLRVYVSHNVAKGINAATVDARDQVAVHMTYKDTNDFSYFLGGLIAGQRLVLTDFEGSLDLIIDVNSIVDNSGTPIADVDIFLEGCSPGSCVPTSSPMPSAGPSSAPSMATDSPSTSPSAGPSAAPSMATAAPSIGPSSNPSMDMNTPSAEPSLGPSRGPSSPSESPSSGPSTGPSLGPSMKTDSPSAGPSAHPSAGPSSAPSSKPSYMPSDSPTPELSSVPSFSPSTSPTHAPTEVASEAPSPMPSGVPTVRVSPNTCRVDDKENMCPGNRVAICELFRGDKYRQACLKPNQIDGLLIGESIPGRPGRILAGCGCCLEDPSIQNNLKSGDFDYKFGQQWRHICEL